MTQPKKLTVASVKKQHKKEFGEQKKVILRNGEYVLIQKKFRKTSIQKFVMEYIDVIESIKRRDISTEVLQELSFVYYMLLLRNFTNLDIIPTEVEQMIILCQELNDLDLLEEILSHFDENEINKIKELIDKMTENANQENLSDLIAELFVSSNMDKVTYNVNESQGEQILKEAAEDGE